MFSAQLRKRGGSISLLLAALLSPLAVHAQDTMGAMPKTGDIAKDFASMMQMHHQQAVEMAKMELANGKFAEVKAMARKIIADQQNEIAQFDKWLAAHKWELAPSAFGCLEIDFRWTD